MSKKSFWTAIQAVFVSVTASTAFAGLIIEFDAESGQSPADLGYIEATPQTSGTHATTSVPGLGSNVWEVSVNGWSGGYILDLDGLVDLAAGFRFSAFFRGLDTPQGGAHGNIERNRLTGSFPARPFFSQTVVGQWYWLEMNRLPGENTFNRSLWTVDHQTGTKTLQDQDFDVDGVFLGSPGSQTLANSIAFYMQNAGSTFMRTQFDNVRFEVIPEPTSSAMAVLLFYLVLAYRARSSIDNMLTEVCRRGHAS
ncbi:MAG: hypothetical protein KDA57_12725 [Planctomycetales bacterium]|nr:hypothetical protein [Planctomycetales bacterium]